MTYIYLLAPHFDGDGVLLLHLGAHFAQVGQRLPARLDGAAARHAVTLARRREAVRHDLQRQLRALKLRHACSHPDGQWTKAFGHSTKKGHLVGRQLQPDVWNGRGPNIKQEVPGGNPDGRSFPVHGGWGGGG